MKTIKITFLVFLILTLAGNCFGEEFNGVSMPIRNVLYDFEGVTRELALMPFCSPESQTSCIMGRNPKIRLLSGSQGNIDEDKLRSAALLAFQFNASPGLLKTRKVEFFILCSNTVCVDEKVTQMVGNLPNLVLKIKYTESVIEALRTQLEKLEQEPLIEWRDPLTLKQKRNSLKENEDKLEKLKSQWTYSVTSLPMDTIKNCALVVYDHGAPGSWESASYMQIGDLDASFEVNQSFQSLILRAIMAANQELASGAEVFFDEHLSPSNLIMTLLIDRGLHYGMPVIRACAASGLRDLARATSCACGEGALPAFEVALKRGVCGAGASAADDVVRFMNSSKLSSNSGSEIIQQHIQFLRGYGTLTDEMAKEFSNFARLMGDPKVLESGLRQVISDYEAWLIRTGGQRGSSSLSTFLTGHLESRGYEVRKFNRVISTVEEWQQTFNDSVRPLVPLEDFYNSAEAAKCGISFYSHEKHIHALQIAVLDAMDPQAVKYFLKHFGLVPPFTMATGAKYPQFYYRGSFWGVLMDNSFFETAYSNIGTRELALKTNYLYHSQDYWTALARLIIREGCSGSTF